MVSVAPCAQAGGGKNPPAGGTFGLVAGGVERLLLELLLLAPPVVERSNAGADDSVDERLLVVDVRDRLVGKVDLEEVTQRTPALLDVPHQQAVGRNVLPHGLVVAVEG